MQPHSTRRPRPFEWLLAAVITVVAGFIFLNASLLSTYDAFHIDLSINLVASDALQDGESPYGRTTLRERAEALGSPTQDVYSQLFTSYIQPPTSAMLLTPLSFLPWRDATRAGLVFNHVILLAAVGLTLYTMRPALSLPWLIAGATVVLAAFSQVYSSFVLGQWDATLLLLLCIAFWAAATRHDPIAGIAIALAAAIKLVPALLLLYFLWRGRYQIVAWGFGAGAGLFLVSLAYAGVDIYRTYLTDSLPSLLKGSTHYSNNTVQALIARASTPEVINGLAEVDYLDEVPSGLSARLASSAVTIAVLAAVALILGRPRRADLPRERLFAEFYLVVTAGLLISSVTWEFYAVWLLPVFLAVFLAPSRLIPAAPLLRFGLLAALAFAFIGLNYPGDFWLFPPDFAMFDPGHALHHPDWVPGVWVEDKLRLYHNHLDAVLLLRLPALLLTAAALAAIALLWRRHEDEMPPEVVPAASKASAS